METKIVVRNFHIVYTLLVLRYAATGQVNSPKPKHRVCGNMLPDQGYRKSQGAVTDLWSNGGTMIGKESRCNAEKTCSSATPFTTNHMISLGIEHGARQWESKF
jgi:hypothetical protein